MGERDNWITEAFGDVRKMLDCKRCAGVEKRLPPNKPWECPECGTRYTVVDTDAMLSAAEETGK